MKTYCITIWHLSRSRCALLNEDWNVAVVKAGLEEWKSRFMSGMLLVPLRTAIVPPCTGLAESPHMMVGICGVLIMAPRDESK